MKDLRNSGRRGLGMVSSLFTKVIVLALCMSLALGTTAFASDAGTEGGTTASSADGGGSNDNAGSGDNSSSGTNGNAGSGDNSSSGTNGNVGSGDNSGSDSKNNADSGDNSGSDSKNNADSGDNSDSGSKDNADSADNGDSDSKDSTAPKNESVSGEVSKEGNQASDSDGQAAGEQQDSDGQVADEVTSPDTEENKQADSEQEQPADETSGTTEGTVEEPTEEPTEEPAGNEELPPIEVTQEQQEAVEKAIEEFENPMLMSMRTEDGSNKPVSDFDALKEAIANAPTNGEEVCIVVEGPINVAETLKIPAGANVKLILNGQILTFTGTGNAMFEVAGELSVWDENPDDPADDQTTGSNEPSTPSSSNRDSSVSGNSSQSDKPSNPSSSDKNSSVSKGNVTVSKETSNEKETADSAPETGSGAAEQKDSLEKVIETWVNKDASVKETQEVVQEVLKEVGTITVEKSASVVFNVVLGGKLNLFGGIINGSGIDNLTGVKVDKNSEFEMSGGVITGMTNSGVIINGGEATISGGAAIVNNSTKGNGGGISVKNGGTLTMNGGLVAGNEAIFDGKSENHNGYVSWANGLYKGVYGGASGNGGGIAVDESTFTMTGGKIHGNNAATGEGQYDRYGTSALDGLGGGVYVVGENASFALSGKGVISNNEAGAGGGIFIHTRNAAGTGNADGALFTMTGGEVSGNTALYGEGGGIFINSRFKDPDKNNTITAGKITGNKTETTKDLGGGGIYVNNEGTLNIQNAIVTANIAQGLGGGFAACVHGRTIVFTENGAIFFANDNKGDAFTDGHKNEWNEFKGNGTKIDGHDIWEDLDEFKALAKDIFTASDMGTDGSNGGILLGNKTLFDGDASWEGYRFFYENGEVVSEKIEYDENGKVIYANRLLGVTSNPDDAAVQKALEVINNALSGYLIITGNESSVHGGGIANNGILTIGVKQDTFEETPDEVSKDFELDKKLEKDENAPEDTPDRVLQENEFTFILKDGSGKELFEGTNDADGKVDIKIPGFNKPGTYAYLVSEKNDGQTTVIYDGNVYVVVVEVEEIKSSEIVNIGGVEYTIERSELVAGEPKFYKAVLDENGNVMCDENGNPLYKEEIEGGIIFNNKYTKPNEQKDTEDPTPENPTPGTPNGSDRPSRNTDVDVSETEVPLADMPEIEIPDEDVPLTDVSEEMEINDPEVPLGDVPRTGDAPVFPFAAAIFAFCGMLLAKLGKGNKETK